jgi:ABC-type lipoprotein export system ATPase subunit
MTERLSEDQRQIRDIMEKVEAFYLTTHNDAEVKREIDVVVRGASRAAKDGHILLITAESQSGKTTMVNHWMNIHRSFPSQSRTTTRLTRCSRSRRRRTAQWRVWVARWRCA